MDLVLTGGKVFTADAALTVAEAVAVHDGRIAWVGPAAEARAHVGPDPRPRPRGPDGPAGLPGRALPPGRVRRRPVALHLHDAHSREACLETIARYAAENPEPEWIVGSGWSIDSFAHGTPSRDDLDEILPDRPAFLENRDGHGAWVNSRALALAGVTTRHP